MTLPGSRLGAAVAAAAAFGLAALCPAQSKVGTTALPFLGIAVGPRASAMGGAFAALSDDATCLYYNPGGMARARGSRFTAAHTDWLVGTGYNWVGGVLSLGSGGSVGLHLAMLDYGEEDVNTVLEPEGTGEKWGASDFAAGLSYGRALTDRFSIGGTVKIVQQRIWHESATAFALDVGLLFVTPFRDLRLGMSICNFGTDLRLDGRDLLRRVDLDPAVGGDNEAVVARLKTDAWPLPLLFRVGLALDAWNSRAGRLTLAVDALRPSDNTECLQVGGEAALYDRVFLRAGYASLFRSGSEQGLTAGCGVRLPLSGRAAWTADFGYADHGILQTVRSLSLGLEF
jgi:hypothetical protein